MREFQERRRVKRLLHSRYAIAAMAIVALLLLHSVWDVYGKYAKSREIAERMQADYASLQAREDSLTKSIDALSTPEGQEKEIRDRFGVVKPGEKMIVLVGDTSTRDKPVAASPGWWSRFLGLFGL